MKAVYIREHGGREVLTYGDMPDPVIGPNDVKIRVRACAVQPRGRVHEARSQGHPAWPGPAPHSGGRRRWRRGRGRVGGDAGQGAGQGRHQPQAHLLPVPVLRRGRARALYQPSMLGSTTNGSYAELLKAPAVNAVRLPGSVSYEEAAALPTVFLPSWNILVRRARLQSWETALILSASSGVGTAAIQVAKNVIGARVIATTSTDEKARKARELGADEVIVYSRENIRQRVKELTEGRGVNVVVDHVGADFWPAASASLAPGGRYGICGVTTGYQVDLQMGLLFLRNQTVFGVFMGRKEDLRQIVELAGKGVIRSVIHGTFPLRDAAKAHQVMESKSLFGKLILRP